MVQFKSQDELRKFLITSRLIRPEQWSDVEGDSENGESVSETLKRMERLQILTHLQTKRIQKGSPSRVAFGRPNPPNLRECSRDKFTLDLSPNPTDAPPRNHINTFVFCIRPTVFMDRERVCGCYS